MAKRPTSSSKTYLVAEAIRASGLPENKVDVQLFLECDGVRQTDFNTVCPGGTIAARYVSVEVANDVETYFDWAALARIIGYKAFNRTVKVTGDSLVRFQ